MKASVSCHDGLDKPHPPSSTNDATLQYDLRLAEFADLGSFRGPI